jgi:hypothetical protein
MFSNFVLCLSLASYFRTGHAAIYHLRSSVQFPTEIGSHAELAHIWNKINGDYCDHLKI